MIMRSLIGLATALISTIGAPAPRADAAPSIALVPVLSGLSSPVLVTSARDGSQRLFIVEQRGVIKVLQPGQTVPTDFLDIRSKVLAGGEQGLLGLTFHPQFASNRRFFVDYTRKTDGATVIAEYQVPTTGANVADTTETVLLVIAQPFANHNGGMVEFGPDGFLYIAMGDGGSGNDPGNRGQDTTTLLGKILRIDVDHPNGAQPYSSPATNPFLGSVAGADEIYAYGFRNPWRFSFDRSTGDLYAGDVGQGAREEIDIVTLGGNYGWRTWEGTLCTGLNGSPCDPAGFVFPIAEYGHTGGRCAVTGGYVYRGSRSSLPAGSYVYADYCTGEMFLLDSGTSSLLLDTALNISAFGEDESGELYVVGLGGTVHRIAAADAVPDTTITAGPTGSLMVRDVSFTWTGSDNATPVGNLVYAYRLDPLEATFSAFGSATSKSYAALPSGTYTFHVKALNQAGNEDPTPATRTFTVALMPPPITSPAPGSILASTTVTFTGGHTSADGQHWLFVGTTAGAYDLFTRDLGSGHAATVSGLPATGTIYVTYWTYFTGIGWTSTGQQYTMNVTGPPSFDYALSNSGGVTVTRGASGGTTITATLSAGTSQAVSVAASGLPGGATAGFSAGTCTPTCSTTLTISTTASTPTGTFPITVTGSPLGRTTALNLVVNPIVPPPITSPAPGSILASTTVTFTGGHTSADGQHWLFVGTTAGAYDLFTRDLGSGHAATVSGLPATGTIYVTYWTYFAGIGWTSTSQQYTR
jgi:glucose/arabinose dehydrogenase